MLKDNNGITNVIDFPVRPRQESDLLGVEQRVLGAMMLDGAALARVSGILEPDHFYRGLHRKIYSVVMSLWRKAKPVGIVTVVEELRRRGQLEATGGAAYIAALIEACPTTKEIERDADALVDASVQRRLAKGSQDSLADIEQRIRDSEFDQRLRDGDFDATLFQSLCCDVGALAAAWNNHSEIDKATVNALYTTSVTLWNRVIDSTETEKLSSLTVREAAVEFSRLLQECFGGR